MEMTQGVCLFLPSSIGNNPKRVGERDKDIKYIEIKITWGALRADYSPTPDDIIYTDIVITNNDGER